MEGAGSSQQYSPFLVPRKWLAPAGQRMRQVVWPPSCPESEICAMPQKGEDCHPWRCWELRGLHRFSVNSWPYQPDRMVTSCSKEVGPMEHQLRQYVFHLDYRKKKRRLCCKIVHASLYKFRKWRLWDLLAWSLLWESMKTNRWKYLFQSNRWYLV